MFVIKKWRIIFTVLQYIMLIQTNGQLLITGIYENADLYICTLVANMGDCVVGKRRHSRSARSGWI